jgi:hypothetical protein
VVYLDAEAASLEIWAPVPHRLDQPDELVLIGRKSTVSRCHRPTEESDRVPILDEHSPKAMG